MQEVGPSAPWGSAPIVGLAFGPGGYVILLTSAAHLFTWMPPGGIPAEIALPAVSLLNVFVSFYRMLLLADLDALFTTLPEGVRIPVLQLNRLGQVVGWAMVLPS